MSIFSTRKIAIFILSIMAICMMSIIPVSATSVNTSVVDTTKQGAQLGETNLNNQGNPAGLPSASIEDLESRTEGKMFSLVSLLQTVGKPFLIICFIASTVFTIIGFLGKAGAWKGLIGMLLSGVLYACVMYAPEIVNWIQIWAAS